MYLKADVEVMYWNNKLYRLTYTHIPTIPVVGNKKTIVFENNSPVKLGMDRKIISGKVKIILNPSDGVKYT